VDTRNNIRVLDEDEIPHKILFEQQEDSNVKSYKFDQFFILVKFFSKVDQKN